MFLMDTKKQILNIYNILCNSLQIILYKKIIINSLYLNIKIKKKIFKFFINFQIITKWILEIVYPIFDICVKYLYRYQILETNSLGIEFYQKFTRKFEIYQAN